MRLDNIFSELKITIDNGKPKIRGKNLKTNSDIKKTLNVNLNKIERIKEELNLIIKNRFTKEQLIAIHQYQISGLNQIYSNDSIMIAIDLINSYGDYYDEFDNMNIKKKIDLIDIIIAGNSGSGKSTLIKSMMNDICKNIFSVIEGVRETSLFKTFYYLLSDWRLLTNYKIKHSENHLYIKPQFKDKKEIIDIIHLNILKFVTKHNKYLFSSNKSDDSELWDKSIEKSLDEFLCDEEKVFNLQILLGKYSTEDSGVYKEIKRLLKKYLLDLEVLKLKNLQKLVNSEDEIKNSKIEYMINEKNSSYEENEKILENINIDYLKIAEESRVELEKEIMMFLFERFVENIKKTFNSVFDDSDNEVDYEKVIRKLNKYIVYELPSKDKKKEENIKLSKNLRGILKKIYFSNKNIDIDNIGISPLINVLEVILPHNPKIKLGSNNYRIIDCVGLDHGNKVTKERIAKRLASDINEYEPDVILLNLNFSEKIDSLEEAFKYIERIGYRDRTVILASHLDLLFKNEAENEYINEYLVTNEFDKLVKELSSETLEKYEEKNCYGLFTKEDLSKEDLEKINKVIIKKHFASIYDIVKSTVKNEINTSIKISYEEYKSRLVFIDKCNKLPIVVENDLELNNAMDKIFDITSKIKGRLSDKVVLGNKGYVDLQVDSNNYSKVIHYVISKFSDQQKDLYTKSNSDLIWNTLDCGIYEMKNNRPGQKYGVSYDITPGEDFKYLLFKVLDAENLNIKLFDWAFNFVVEPIQENEVYTRLKDSFLKYFNKHLNEVMHYYFITSNIYVYDLIYDVRFGKNRIYPFEPMTTERKIRMRELLVKLANNQTQIDILVQVAKEKAIQELMDKNIC